MACRRNEDKLKRRNPTVKTVMICYQIRNPYDGALRFVRTRLRSMYYIDTSRVCIADAYWPAVFLLHHKKKLTVIYI